MTAELVCLKKGEDVTSIESIRKLEPDEQNQVRDAIKTHFEFDSNRSLYEICRRNHDDLLQYWDSQIKTFSTTQKFDLSIGLDITLEMNRKLLSYLASFRTFIDHTETRLKRSNETAQLKEFKDRAAKHYDNQFAYRFLWKLRNYVQHCGLPPSGVNFSATQKGEQNFFFGNYHFNTSALRDGYDWGAKITQDLQNQSADLDVLSLVAEMNESLEELNHWLATQEVARLKKDFHLLIKLYEESQRVKPGSHPAIAEFEHTAPPTR